MKTLQNNPQFKAFASSIDYGIIVGSHDGNILDFNQAALDMFGYTEEELMNQPITTIMPLRFKSPDIKKQAELYLGKTSRLFGVTKDGKEFPIELHLSTWHNTQGEQYYTASIRKYSALENNLSWILASSAVATIALAGVLIYLSLRF